MHLGYARVSTGDQNPDLQLTALRQAGCIRLFTDTATGGACPTTGIDKVSESPDRWRYPHRLETGSSRAVAAGFDYSAG